VNTATGPFQGTADLVITENSEEIAAEVETEIDSELARLTAIADEVAKANEHARALKLSVRADRVQSQLVQPVIPEQAAAEVDNETTPNHPNRAARRRAAKVEEQKRKDQHKEVERRAQERYARLRLMPSLLRQGSRADETMETNVLDEACSASRMKKKKPPRNFSDDQVAIDLQKALWNSKLKYSR